VPKSDINIDSGSTSETGLRSPLEEIIYFTPKYVITYLEMAKYNITENILLLLQKIFAVISTLTKPQADIPGLVAFHFLVPKIYEQIHILYLP